MKLPVMLQLSPFSLVSDLHSSNGESVLRIDTVNDNGEGSGLHATTRIEREVCLAFCFRRFVQSGYHDDDRNLLCPDHSPKIRYRVS
jgi:hypothetical protein